MAPLYEPVQRTVDYAALIQASDGNFYGTTPSSVFMMTADGTVTVLHRFAATVDGIFSDAALIQGTDGNFYGTTAAGGPFDCGTVFNIASDGAFAVLYTFTGGADGCNPHGALIQATDGDFYGTTSTGGDFGSGVVFRFRMP